jgi:hypothetical protein
VPADHGALDLAVHDTVAGWLERDGPSDSIKYTLQT